MTNDMTTSGSTSHDFQRYLTQEQVDHFHTFGFLVLPQLLTADEMTRLTEEVERSHTDAYGYLNGARPEGQGLPSYLLPMMSTERTPFSLELLEDRRFFGVANELVRARALPTFAESILLFTQTPLHRDCMPGMHGVTFAVYLEPLTADTGALRFLAGSHHADFSAASEGWKKKYGIWAEEWGEKAVRQQVSDLPLTVAETRRGDVIVFDWQIWHASINGVDRLQWSVSYANEPTTAEEEDVFSRFFHSAGSVDPDAPYDTTAYPRYDREWMRQARDNPRMAPVIARMRELHMIGNPDDPEYGTSGGPVSRAAHG
ncbi:phytanoyl-CoA dioxygenase family protein [Solwaraspora sp. WMMD1047]|uniref:phytanoyl-CoA dioxygenase family protein n=1 Tax=Solwaraspora sp. WMMD1047 TaxID=3016102 RepID=UPI00241729CF|nr:phytanoyl-CoA dioxygenase family protein [Solwaraspora sp. WMMD1047]MDG4830613.1 phytanoyl-CoA dioxygenase family protein [Solwaraspora sp. WMMD1047]